MTAAHRVLKPDWPSFSESERAAIWGVLRKQPRSAKGGRPRTSNDQEIFAGIVRTLLSGRGWASIRRPSGSTCFRRLQRWQEDGTWVALWTALLPLVHVRRLHQLSAVMLDHGAPRIKHHVGIARLPKRGVQPP